MASGAPKMLPTSREYAPQSIPNWNSCTSPVTTPMATLMTSSVPKNLVSRRYSSRLVRYHVVCSSAVRKASPIVTGTKKKWLTVTNPNCHRASSTFTIYSLGSRAHTAGQMQRWSCHRPRRRPPLATFVAQEPPGIPRPG